MGIREFFGMKPAAAVVAKDTAPAKPAALDMTQLKTVNFKLDLTLAAIPGAQKLLDKCHALGGVSQGPKPGEATTKVSWNIWTHSAKTNEHYGHGLTDKQIAEGDIIVVVQEDPKGPALPLGDPREVRGTVVAMHRLCDMSHQYSACADGGHWGNMKVQAFGKAGEKATLSWRIINVADDGRVRGGGFPPPRPANHKDGSGAGTAGGEYAGRKWEVTIGQHASVPIIEDEH